LKTPIPFEAAFGVPFLRDDGGGVRPSNLEWSYRITGGRRASLEAFSPWAPGPGLARFELVPSDFDSDGPHRLVLQARARTTGLTDAWELDLPHVPFPFELDSRLEVASLLALPDDARGEQMGRSIRLSLDEGAGDGTEGVPAFAPLNAGLAIRGVPVLEVASPMPCDLAHAVAVELSGVPGWHPAGVVVVSGQGGGPTGAGAVRRVPLGPIGPLPDDAVDRPGPRALRARLVADPDLGWADPDIRSIWPGTIVTDWITVRLSRS